MEMFKAADYARLRGAIGIAQHELDRELVQHPQLLMESCEMLSNAIRQRDEREYEFKLACAMEAARLRDELINGKKMSEAAIASEVPLAENVQTARLAVEDAKASVGFWSALVEGMRAKGSSLKRLAELTATGFLAPSTSYEDTRSAMAAARRAGSSYDSLRGGMEGAARAEAPPRRRPG